MKGMLLAEWTKFRSVRSTPVLAVAVIVTSAAFGWLFGNAGALAYLRATPQEQLEFVPLHAGTRGILLIQLLVAGLGVLVATTEYNFGTMRASVAAVGRRERLPAAKSVLVVLVTLLVGLLAAPAMFLTSQLALTAGGAPRTWFGDPSVTRFLLLTPVVLALLALFGLALGFLLRSTTAAVNVSTAFLLFPVLSDIAPEAVQDFATTYWPNAAGFQAMAMMDASSLGLWGGLGLLLAFVAAMLTATLVRFRTRDV
jgi:ABC-2 type transport system permease protein